MAGNILAMCRWRRWCSSDQRGRGYVLGGFISGNEPVRGWRHLGASPSQVVDTPRWGEELGAPRTRLLLTLVRAGFEPFRARAMSVRFLTFRAEGFSYIVR
jgi:hypothetical protein